MDVATLKTRILHFMNRDSSTFITAEHDGILAAINMSREYAQQLVDFEFTKETFDLTLDDSGIDWTELTNDNGTFRIKKIYGLYDSENWQPIELITDKDRMLGIVANGVMLQGTKLYAVGEPANIKLVAFVWLEELDSDEDTDFLLDNCATWLLYSAIGHLNFYLKEDQRVQLSTGLLSTAWQAVVTWNERITENATSINLD